MPWEYLYYTATVDLGWSDQQFWDNSLRTLMALRDQHEKVVRSRARQIGYMTACMMNGQDPDEVAMDPQEIRRRELEMGNAMW